MKSHDIDYKIFGNDLQIVEIELDPGETIIAEAGAMVYMEENIKFEVKLGDGSTPNQSILEKVFQASSRIITGESLFLTHFTQSGINKGKVAFSAPYPGTIICVDLSQMNQSLIVQKDGFLCAALGTRLSIFFNQKLGSGLFGGEGFILQRLEGDGKLFIHACGTVLEKELRNETIRIDTGCIVAFEPTLSFDVENTGNLKSMLFGGEGMFFATLRGTGKVWLQSIPIRKLIHALNPAGSNSGKENSSLLGDLFKR